MQDLDLVLEVKAPIAVHLRPCMSQERQLAVNTTRKTRRHANVTQCDAGEAWKGVLEVGDLRHRGKEKRGSQNVFRR